MNAHRQPRRIRPPARAAAAVAAAAAIAAIPALGHAPIHRRTPAPGATARNVHSVELDFSDHVITGLIDVYHGSTRIAARTSGPIRSNTALRATFARSLAPGTYTARWRALARDGHRQHGSWSFTAA